MKQTRYIYESKTGWIGESTIPQTDFNFGKLIGTIDLDVEPPMKEVVKEETALLSTWDNRKTIENFLPPDAYDPKVTFKVKVAQ